MFFFNSPVPCLPPQYVTYDVPGLSMLLAKWQPVPAHCRNGVILGYRVKYRRLDGGSPARIESTTAEVLHAFLYDMDIYANYSIEISAFTRKGEGTAMLDLALPDTLGTSLDLAHFIDLSPNCSSSWFVIRVNLLHSSPSLYLLGLLFSLNGVL